MKKLTLTQEDPVIFVSENAKSAWDEACKYTSKQREKGIDRGYSVAYAVIITPIQVECGVVVDKVKKPMIKAGTPIKTNV